MKLRCNNTLCDYCVRDNVDMKNSYVCVLINVSLRADDDTVNDDYVRCACFEPRYHKKLDEGEQHE